MTDPERRRCDSCDCEGFRLTYAPAHNAHLCDGCHERIVGSPCNHQWDALRSIPPSWRCRLCHEVSHVRPVKTA